MSRGIATSNRPRQSAGRRLTHYRAQPEMSTSLKTEPTWSIEMLLLNEALARSRMQQAAPRRARWGANRPARVVAATAARLRDRL
jgi:hypothetical protein